MVRGKGEVSIRTRPFGRVMQKLNGSRPHARPVSIRTRPFGRVMRKALPELIADIGFNPHPAFRPGDAVAGRRRWRRSSTFQSAPGLSAG